MNLHDLDTPCAILDVTRMQANIERMQNRMDHLGVRFRPHAKTSKCVEVVNAQIEAGAQGITVSTLKEAEEFFAAGIADILYAVCISAGKLPRVLALRRAGCKLKVIVDSLASARQVCDFGRMHQESFDVWIEVDTDGHRGGIQPGGDLLLEVAQALTCGGQQMGGVLTHAGSSYELHTPTALEAMAEQERAGCVLAAERIRAAGMACPEVSVGSTPTAFSATHLDGVTEVRAGVYAFFDLVMLNVGVCRMQDLALSVLATVIGHQKDKGWVIVDAGWMAMSRDRGTAKQHHDYGYGQVCSASGEPIDGITMVSANQEHGIIAAQSQASDPDIEARFPMGSRVRILPNHACATGAQYDVMYALDAQGDVRPWKRFRGW